MNQIYIAICYRKILYFYQITRNQNYVQLIIGNDFVKIEN